MSAGSQSPANLSEQQKRALLEKLLKEKVASLKSYRASYGQEWFWFLDQMRSSHFTLHVVTIIEMNGRLDVQALDRTVQELVRRHELLRSYIRPVNGLATVSIQPAGTVPVPLTDLRSLAPEERKAAVERRLAEEGERPFDMEKGPLLRTELLRLDEHEHVFIYTLHHCVADDWARRVFFRELVLLYSAFSGDRPSPLVPLRAQHADFAKVQRELLQGAPLEQRLSYWTQKLKGAPQLLNLPSDRPRPPVQSGKAGTLELILPPNVYQAIDQARVSTGFTPFMIMLAAYNALLSRLSGQTDVLVGCPIANRNKSEYEGVIGFFANNIVLRTNLTGNPTFRELVGRVQRGTLEAIPHQDLPFERLLQVLHKGRAGNLAHSPVFQASFNFIKFPLGMDLPGLQLRGRTVLRNRTVYDLVLFMEQEGPEIRILVLYNADIFDPPRVRKMLDAYLSILARALEAPSTRLSEFELGEALDAPARSGFELPERTAPANLVEARDELEQQLEGILKELLLLDPLETLGVEENFFALGGHSLQVAQLMSLVREKFGVRIEPRAFFEAPTLGALAQAIRTARQAGTGR